MYKACSICRYHDKGTCTSPHIKVKENVFSLMGVHEQRKNKILRIFSTFPLRTWCGKNAKYYEANYYY